jgi:ribosomal-protein-alanine N-acetyltransferase
MEVTIRAALPGDISAIGAIQNESPEASAWPPESYLTYDCRVALVDGRIAGFLVTRGTAPGESEILNLAVGRQYRRRGIARRLLGEALQAGGAWYLEVRESNAPAIALYRQAGFAVAGVRPGYYPDSSESGIVMKLRS